MKEDHTMTHARGRGANDNSQEEKGGGGRKEEGKKRT